MKRNNRVRHGVALITVLLLALVCTMLAGSLLNITRTSRFAHLHQESWTKALNAANSGLDYAKSRLMADQLLATSSSSFSVSNGGLSVVESGSDAETFRIVGTQADLDQSFEVRVYNNFTGITDQNPPSWSKSGIQVPPRRVLMRVRGTCGTTTRSFEVLLAKATVGVAALHAGKDVSLENSQPSGIDATYPKGKTLLATRDIYIAGTDHNRFQTSPGRVRAGHDVVVNTTTATMNSAGDISGSGISLGANLGQVPAVEDDLNGKVEMGTAPASSRFNEDKLQSPGGSSLTGDLNPGTYKFVTHSQVEFTDSSGQKHTYNNIIPTSGQAYVKIRDYELQAVGHVKVAGNLDVSGTETIVDFPEDQFGNHISDGNGGFVSTQKTVDYPVTVTVGLDASGYPALKKPYEHRLEVVGNLTVAGDISGAGQVIVRESAAGAGELHVQGNSALSASRTHGMVITAQNGVHFTDVPNNAAEIPAAMTAADTIAFSLVPSTLPPASANGKILDKLATANSSDLETLAGGDDDYDKGNPSNNETLRRVPLPTSNYFQDGLAIYGITPTLKAKSLTGGLHLDTVLLDAPTSSRSTQITGSALMIEYLTYCNANGGMTLGRHLRMREFVKSFRRGEPDASWINYQDTGNGFADHGSDVRRLAILELYAFRQDAMLRKQNLRQYLTSLNVGTVAYQETNRLRSLFGGLIYSPNSVSLLSQAGVDMHGMVISQSGSIQVRGPSTNLLFDPTIIEDQLDLAKVGFTQLFYWSDE